MLKKCADTLCYKTEPYWPTLNQCSAASQQSRKGSEQTKSTSTPTLTTSVGKSR